MDELFSAIFWEYADDIILLVLSVLGMLAALGVLLFPTIVAAIASRYVQGPRRKILLGTAGVVLLVIGGLYYKDLPVNYIHSAPWRDHSCLGASKGERDEMTPFVAPRGSYPVEAERAAFDSPVYSHWKIIAAIDNSLTKRMYCSDETNKLVFIYQAIKFLMTMPATIAEFIVKRLLWWFLWEGIVLGAFAYVSPLLPAAALLFFRAARSP